MAAASRGSATDWLRAWCAAADELEPTVVLASAIARIAGTVGLDPTAAAAFLGAADPGCATLPIPADALALGALQQALSSDRRDRKSSGAYFTPNELAHALTDATLAPLLADRRTGPCFVIDPACGAGAFLIHALRALCTDATSAAARRAALESLRGIDIDGTTARLCRAALWLETADRGLSPAELDGLVVIGDALLGTSRADGMATGSRAERDAACARHFAGLPSPRFVHWDLDFPGVAARGGFDAVLANPPWDIDRPDARAFFERFEPAFRDLDKQAALAAQRALCARDPELAAAWLAENASFAARATLCRSRFRLRPESGDPNAYQRFVELGLGMLRHGGRLGMLTPAGIYADLGSRPLREVLLDENRWERLCGFENRSRLFPAVDARFKLAAIVVTKGERTRTIRTAFMQRSAEALSAEATPFDASTLDRLSPRSRAFVEIDEPARLSLLERLYRCGVTFGAPDAWSIRFRRELDLTLDSHRFAMLRAPAELPQGHVPLWEGRMIEQFTASAKGWCDGHGRRARWRAIDWPADAIEPRAAVTPSELARIDPEHERPKIGFMAIGSATNARSMIATVLWRAACGNSVPVLRCRTAPDGTPGEFALCAVLNSFVYDFALRARLAGNNLNRFVLDETPLPRPHGLFAVGNLARTVAALCWTAPWFDAAQDLVPGPRLAPLRDPRRRRIVRAALDAVVAHAWGLDQAALRIVLRDCDLPLAELRDDTLRASLDPKDFWRIDRSLPPHARHPTLTLAFADRLQAGTNPSDLLDQVAAHATGDP